MVMTPYVWVARHGGVHHWPKGLRQALAGVRAGPADLPAGAVGAVPARAAIGRGTALLHGKEGFPTWLASLERIEVLVLDDWASSNASASGATRCATRRAAPWPHDEGGPEKTQWAPKLY